MASPTNHLKKMNINSFHWEIQNEWTTKVIHGLGGLGWLEKEPILLKGLKRVGGFDLQTPLYYTKQISR